jgi:hypothetical protein
MEDGLTVLASPQVQSAARTKRTAIEWPSAVRVTNWQKLCNGIDWNDGIFHIIVGTNEPQGN